MNYVKSRFDVNADKTPSGWLVSIETREGTSNTWLKIHVADEEDQTLIQEFQYILERLRPILESLSGEGEDILVEP